MIVEKMKKNQIQKYVGIPIILWYSPGPKIKRLEGVPFRSAAETFDFEHLERSRITKINSKDVIYCCPKDIKHVSKQQFMSLFDVLKLGKIKSAFPSEVISELEKYIDDLPEPLKTFVTDCFNGVKNLDPNLDPVYLDISKCWFEYVFSKIP